MQCQCSPNLRTRCPRPIQPMFRCHLGTVTSGYRMVVLLVCYSAASHHLVPPNHSAKLFEMHRMPDLCLSVVEITTWGVRFWSTIGKFSWALLVRNSRSRGERSATRGKYPPEDQLQVPSMPCRSGWHDLNSGSLIGWLVRQPMPERATTADLQPPESFPALEVNLNAAGGTESNFDHHSDNHVCQKMYRSLASRRLLSRVLECF